MSPLENLVLNLTKSVNKESSNILDDQTAWIERQHEFLRLIQMKVEKERLTRDQRHQAVILEGRKRQLDCKLL